MSNPYLNWDQECGHSTPKAMTDAEFMLEYAARRKQAILAASTDSSRAKFQLLAELNALEALAKIDCSCVEWSRMPCDPCLARRAFREAMERK